MEDIKMMRVTVAAKKVKQRQDELRDARLDLYRAAAEAHAGGGSPAVIAAAAGWKTRKSVYDAGKALAALAAPDVPEPVVTDAHDDDTEVPF